MTMPALGSRTYDHSGFLNPGCLTLSLRWYIHPRYWHWPMI